MLSHVVCHFYYEPTTAHYEHWACGLCWRLSIVRYVIVATVDLSICWSVDLLICLVMAQRRNRRSEPTSESIFIGLALFLLLLGEGCLFSSCLSIIAHKSSSFLSFTFLFIHVLSISLLPHLRFYLCTTFSFSFLYHFPFLLDAWITSCINDAQRLVQT